MKVDCPKLKKDSKLGKRNVKEKLEKFKKVFAAWGERDLDTSDAESRDQEVNNICLVAKEEKIVEVFYESNFFDELQNAYDELYRESLKKASRNSMLKKQVASFTLEIDKLKKHASRLINENNDLNEQKINHAGIGYHP